MGKKPRIGPTLRERVEKKIQEYGKDLGIGSRQIEGLIEVMEEELVEIDSRLARLEAVARGEIK